LLGHAGKAALNLQVEASAPELGFELEAVLIDLAIAEKIEGAFSPAGHQADAVLPLSDPMVLANAQRIGELSLEIEECTIRAPIAA
jgi:hypothetical protein